MLHISPVLNNTTAITSVSGQFLSKNKLCARGRARLAAEILAGHVQVDDLTIRQTAGLCRVSVPYVTAACRHKSESLAEHFARSTPEEWQQCARLVGPARIWDQMLSPLVV